MHNRAFLLAIILVTSFILGCAGSSNITKLSRTYKRNLGHCRLEEFQKVINKILYIKNQYLDGGNAREMNTQFEYYTEWKPRNPFPDEKALGIFAVETRITVGAKLSAAKTRSIFTNEADFIAYFQAENRVVYLGKQEWEPGPMTRDCRNYFNDISEDMIQEFIAPY